MDTLHDLMMKDHLEEKMAMGRKHLDHYRRKGLGMKTEPESEDESMKVLSNGDVHVHHAPIPQKQESTLSRALPIIATAGMAAGIPLAGIAGYLLSQKDELKPIPPATETIERDYQIGEVLVE